VVEASTRGSRMHPLAHECSRPSTTHRSRRARAPSALRRSSTGVRTLARTPTYPHFGAQGRRVVGWPHSATRSRTWETQPPSPTSPAYTETPTRPAACSRPSRRRRNRLGRIAAEAARNRPVQCRMGDTARCRDCGQGRREHSARASAAERLVGRASTVWSTPTVPMDRTSPGAGR